MSQNSSLRVCSSSPCVVQVSERYVVVAGYQHHMLEGQAFQPDGLLLEFREGTEVRQIATVHKHVTDRQCRMCSVRVRNHDDLHREIALLPKERTTASSTERYTRLYSPPRDTESVV